VKSIKLVLAAVVTAALAIGMPIAASAAQPTTTTTASITWNTSDKNVAQDIDATPSTKTNASGPKITSNAQSADFPGIYFIWDSKQKDNGYLKVAASVFDTYSSFVITTKEANSYNDFTIAVQTGQKETADDCYVFLIPKVVNDKNINMVFISSSVIKPETVGPTDPGDSANPGDSGDSVDPGDSTTYAMHSVGILGYFFDGGGEVRQWPLHWFYLDNPSQCIEPQDIADIYSSWYLQDGIKNPSSNLMTGGDSPKTFDSNNEICYGDLSAKQEDHTYSTNDTEVFFLDPDLADVHDSFDTYVDEVTLWTALYNSPSVSDGDKVILHNDGGIQHYDALLNEYNTTEGHTYFSFTWDDKALYDDWATQLAVGLSEVPH